MNHLGKSLWLAFTISFSYQPARAQMVNDLLTSNEAVGYLGEILDPLACKKATAVQIAELNRGNAKADAFAQKCRAETNNSPWCDQVMRPNPDSISVFRCTYGEEQPHLMIHPNEASWKNAIGAVKLVQELETQGIGVCLIYNWWRPEPYNKNVGGVPSRHPYGTSVDVRFCSGPDMEKAFLQLCKWRKQGLLKAVGYYGTTALHFGMGDSTPNTWGKSCPKSSPME